MVKKSCSGSWVRRRPAVISPSKKTTARVNSGRRPAPSSAPRRLASSRASRRTRRTKAGWATKNRKPAVRMRSTCSHPFAVPLATVASSTRWYQSASAPSKTSR